MIIQSRLDNSGEPWSDAYEVADEQAAAQLEWLSTREQFGPRKEYRAIENGKLAQIDAINGMVIAAGPSGRV